LGWFSDGEEATRLELGSTAGMYHRQEAGNWKTVDSMTR